MDVSGTLHSNTRLTLYSAPVDNPASQQPRRLTGWDNESNRNNGNDGLGSRSGCGLGLNDAVEVEDPVSDKVTRAGGAR